MKTRWTIGASGVAITLASLGASLGFAQAAFAQQASDEIVVTGMRAADKRALDDKRASDTVTESIHATDVGKLPDQNVAEAVKRLPGISVANDQGEGRYVIIRGVNPALANVTLNGRAAAAPEPESRQVKLDDLPSALIGKVEISKTLTADKDANAIAGQVDIITVSAFDRNRFFANGRLYAGHYDINDKSPQGGDITLGDVFGPDKQFGVVLALNTDRRPIRSNNTQGATTWTPIGAGVFPNDFRIRDYNLVRQRDGAAANFDWRPADGVKIYWRNTYSEFSDNETRDQIRYEIPTTAASFTNLTATSGTFNTRASRLVRRREEDDFTLNSSLGGKFDLSGGELDVEASYSHAVKQDPLRSEFTFRTGSNAFSANLDISSDPFVVTPAAASTNTALYPFSAVNYDYRSASEVLWQYTADYKHPIQIGDGSYVKFGAKYVDLTKRNDRDYAAYTPGTAFNLSVAGYTGRDSTFDGRYVVGPRVDYNAAQAYVTANPTSIVFNLAGSQVNNNANDYRVAEKVEAGYAMASLRFGALTVIPGVRVEHTDDDVAAKTINIGATQPYTVDFNTFGGKSYTNWFPGVNLRYDFTDQLVGRAAVTTAIGRPDYNTLPPFISLDPTANPQVTKGNPDLEALTSTNYDATLEYYLPSQGVLSVGVFYKDIDNPIYTGVTSGVAGAQFGLTGTVSVSSPLNASSATVKGVEFNVQTQFTFLPGVLSGFGVAANYTLVDSDEKGLLGRADSVRFTLQSDRVASAQVFYEKYGLSARVAYSYRSPYLDTVGSDPTTDQYTDSNGQWDAHVAYDLTKNFTVFAEGANLSDATWRRYIGEKDHLVEIERYGWSARAGLQFKY